MDDAEWQCSGSVHAYCRYIYDTFLSLEELMLMSAINLSTCPLDKHTHLKLGGSLTLTSSSKWEFVYMWHVWPFFVHFAPQKAAVLVEMLRLSLAKIGNLNGFLRLITAEQRTKSHLAFHNEMCRSHSWAQTKGKKKILFESAGSTNSHSPFLSDRVITSRWIRDRLHQLKLFECPDGIHVWLPLCQNQELDSGDKTAGVVHSYHCHRPTKQKTLVLNHTSHFPKQHKLCQHTDKVTGVLIYVQTT